MAKNSYPKVLFEDNHILVVNKRPSDIVQGDKTGDEPLVEIMKRYLAEKYKKPGKVFLGVVHRIDRPVSGAVVFARTSKALTRLNALFQQREVQKTYWAVVGERPAESEGHLVHYLIRNQKQNKSYASDREGKDSKKAELKFRLLNSTDRYYLLEINPLTGRHHQIRTQLAKMGSPIKGDLKYGANRSNKDASIHLHARAISFVHPIQKERITITAPIPNDNLWKAITDGL